MNSNNNTKDRWDKARIIGKIVGVVGVALIAPAIAFWGHLYAAAIKEKEINQKNLALAVEVLESDPTKSNMPIRQWAAQTLNVYATVKLSPEAMKNLERQPLVPSKSPISFELESAKSWRDGKQRLRLLAINKGSGSVTITRVYIIGGNGNGCYRDLKVNTVFFGYAATAVDLMPVSALVKCLALQAPLAEGYKILAISTEPSIHYKSAAHQPIPYKSHNISFAVKVQTQKGESFTTTLLGGNIDLIKEM